MSLKSYLDPMAAFEKWLTKNPNGGIFEYFGQKFIIKPKNRVH
jgi:hypothetical protein